VAPEDIPVGWKLESVEEAPLPKEGQVMAGAPSGGVILPVSGTDSSGISLPTPDLILPPTAADGSAVATAIQLSSPDAQHPGEPPMPGTDGTSVKPVELRDSLIASKVTITEAPVAASTDADLPKLESVPPSAPESAPDAPHKTSEASTAAAAPASTATEKPAEKPTETSLPAPKSATSSKTAKVKAAAPSEKVVGLQPVSEATPAPSASSNGDAQWDEIVALARKMKEKRVASRTP
jgi:hypothetical protein